VTTAASPGEPGSDQLTTALRRLLLRAVEDDGERGHALAELLGRSVLAATWPGAAEAVRTLTNSDGEQAMPLFSGRDELLAALRRFGWINPDGSASVRELQAREVLASALEQGVHFVVLDICAEHSVEFSREEIAHALGPGACGVARSAAVAATAEPACAVQPVKLAQVTVTSRAVPLLGDIDMPFARERAASKVPVVEEVIASRARGAAARRDPRADPISERARPMTDVAPSAPAQADARARARQPAAAAPPAFELEAPALPAISPASIDALPAFAELPPLEALAASLPHMTGATSGADFGLSMESSEPEARPAALEAAVMVTQLAKLSDDEGTQQAAAEVAAFLKDMALKGGVEESKPGPAQSAAKTLAGMLNAELAADAKRSKRGKRSRRDKTAAEPTTETTAVAAPAQSSSAEPLVLRPPEAWLDDALLGQLADALRQYPEVEWACEVSDGSAVPLIGVRVQPSFLTRVNEITAAVIAVAKSQKMQLSVLLLSDPQQMREARTQGTAFFPWRKRSQKR
jgi:hypothetical protein